MPGSSHESIALFAVGKLLSLGLTIVIAEQNAEFALKVATRGVVISSGQVSFQGDVETLRHGDAMRRAYLGG